MHNNLIKTCKYSILIFQTRYQTNDIDVKTPPILYLYLHLNFISLCSDNSIRAEIAAPACTEETGYKICRDTVLCTAYSSL